MRESKKKRYYRVADQTLFTPDPWEVRYEAETESSGRILKTYTPFRVDQCFTTTARSSQLRATAGIKFHNTRSRPPLSDAGPFMHHLAWFVFHSVPMSSSSSLRKIGGDSHVYFTARLRAFHVHFTQHYINNGLPPKNKNCWKPVSQYLKN